MAKYDEHLAECRNQRQENMELPCRSRSMWLSCCVMLEDDGCMHQESNEKPGKGLSILWSKQRRERPLGSGCEGTTVAGSLTIECTTASAVPPSQWRSGLRDDSETSVSGRTRLMTRQSGNINTLAVCDNSKPTERRCTIKYINFLRGLKRPFELPCSPILKCLKLSQTT